MVSALNDHNDPVEDIAFDMRSVEVSILEKEVALRRKEVTDHELRAKLLASRNEDLHLALEKALAERDSQKADTTAALAAIRKERDLARARAEALEAEVKKLKLRVRRTQRRYAAKRDRVDALHRSRSWRYTYPFRQMSLLLRRIHLLPSITDDRADQNGPRHG